jgi:hypothetical protein
MLVRARHDFGRLPKVEGQRLCRWKFATNKVAAHARIYWAKAIFSAENGLKILEK